MRGLGGLNFGDDFLSINFRRLLPMCRTLKSAENCIAESRRNFKNYNFEMKGLADA